MSTKKYNKSKTKEYNKSKKNKSRLKSRIKSRLKSRLKSNVSNVSNISILSYNVSWESLAGSVKKWSLCNNNTDKTNSKHYSVCVNNISSVFDNSSNTLDFVTLQEATDFQKLITESSRLKNMKYEVHKSGLDTIVTFWDKTYKMKSKIVGYFEEGRPWMATLFTNGICLINVHMGHYDKEEEFKKMENMILEIKNKIKDIKDIKDIKNIKDIKDIKDIKNLRYIISGDFNYDIKEFGESRNYFTLDNTKFYFNPKHILTCSINRRRHNDHVIDSLESPIDINIPKVNYMASDHKPILVEVSI